MPGGASTEADLIPRHGDATTARAARPEPPTSPASPGSSSAAGPAGARVRRAGSAGRLGAADRPAGTGMARPAAGELGLALAAYLIDWLILLVPVVGLTVIIVAVATGSDTGARRSRRSSASSPTWSLAFLYAPLLMAREGRAQRPDAGASRRRHPRDPRRRRADGLRLGGAARDRGQGLRRGGRLVDHPVHPVVPRLLWPLWDDENRALHDMVVSTHVVQALRLRRRRGRSALGRAGPDHLLAAGADADHHDRDAERVGDVVEVGLGVRGQLVDRAAAADVLVPAGQLDVGRPAPCGRSTGGTGTRRTSRPRGRGSARRRGAGRCRSARRAS